MKSFSYKTVSVQQTNEVHAILKEVKPTTSLAHKIVDGTSLFFCKEFYQYFTDNSQSLDRYLETNNLSKSVTSMIEILQEVYPELPEEDIQLKAKLLVLNPSMRQYLDPKTIRVGYRDLIEYDMPDVFLTCSSTDQDNPFYFKTWLKESGVDLAETSVLDVIKGFNASLPRQSIFRATRYNPY